MFVVQVDWWRKTSTKRKVLMESNEIRATDSRYLRKISQYRTQMRHIISILLTLSRKVYF
jgi:hypothetical protein